MPKRHRVRLGDCVTSLAHEHGLTADVLWRADANAEQRETRDPHQLVPGEELEIPDPTPKDENVATGFLHVFRRNGTPATCRLRLVGFDAPLADVEYEFEPAFGEPQQGTTDGDGVLELSVHPQLASGLLRVQDQVLRLELGQLQPVETTFGIKARLANLLLLDEDRVDNRPTEASDLGLELFRRHVGLPVDTPMPDVYERLRCAHDEKNQ